MVEKMIKGPYNPIPESLYAESNAVAILELILWHKYEIGRLYPMKPKVVKAPFLIIK